MFFSVGIDGVKAISAEVWRCWDRGKNYGMKLDQSELDRFNAAIAARCENTDLELVTADRQDYFHIRIPASLCTPAMCA